MTKGFVQRWKGKVLAQLVGVGSGGITVYNSTQAGGNINIGPNTLASLQHQGTLNGTASTVALTVNGYGITKLSSVGGSTYALGAPVPGRRAVVYTDAIGDGARKLSSTAAGATFQSTLAGAAFANLSTIATNSLELIGLSTALWLVKGNVGAVTFTTS